MHRSNNQFALIIGKIGLSGGANLEEQKYTDIKPLIVSEQPREGLQIFICFIFTILALIFIEIFKSSHIK